MLINHLKRDYLKLIISNQDVLVHPLETGWQITDARFSESKHDRVQVNVRRARFRLEWKSHRAHIQLIQSLIHAVIHNFVFILRSQGRCISVSPICALHFCFFSAHKVIKLGASLTSYRIKNFIVVGQ